MCVRVLRMWPTYPCENTKCAQNTGVFQDPQGLPGRGRLSAIMWASRSDDRSPLSSQMPQKRPSCEYTVGNHSRPVAETPLTLVTGEWLNSPFSRFSFPLVFIIIKEPAYETWLQSAEYLCLLNGNNCSCLIHSSDGISCCFRLCEGRKRLNASRKINE